VRMNAESLGHQANTTDGSVALQKSVAPVGAVTTPINSGAAATNVKYVEVDGVPVFWVEASGPTTAGLVFRVGQLDEPPRWRGLTHLVEHLAIAAVPKSYVEFNGETGPATTSFYATGTADEVATYLTTIAHCVTNWSAERVAAEQLVLQAEQCTRGVGGLASIAMRARFGLSGYALMSQPEFGILEELPPQIVRQWSNEWFHRGNAAVWVHGPAPTTLRLNALKSPEPHMHSRRPAHLGTKRAQGPIRLMHPVSGVYAIAQVPQSTALEALCVIVSDELFSRLREAQGISYSPSMCALTIDGNAALAVLQCDSKPEHAITVEYATVRILEEIAEGQISPEAITNCLNRLRRNAAVNTSTGLGEAKRAAESYLFNVPFVPIEQQLASPPTAQEISEAAASVLYEAVWVTMDELNDRRIDTYELEDDEPVAGERHRSLDGDDMTPVLIIGDEGVTIEREECIRSIRFDDLAVALVYLDRGVVLLSRSGRTMAIHPLWWEGISGQLESLISRLPTRCVIARKVKLRDDTPTPLPAVEAEPHKRARLLSKLRK
jgi:zinc protease